MLVNDLRHSQSLARELNDSLVLKCQRKESLDVSYVLIYNHDKSHVQEIRMPFDINVTGGGIINNTGLPSDNIHFDLFLGHKKLDIDFYKDGNINISKIQSVK